MARSRLRQAALEAYERTSAAPQTIQTRGSGVSVHSDIDPPTTEGGSPASLIPCVEDGDASSGSPHWVGRDEWAGSHGPSQELDICLEVWRRMTRMRDSNYPMPESLIGSGRQPIGKSSRRLSARGARHPEQRLAFRATRLSKQSSALFGGVPRDNLSQPPAGSIQPGFGSHPAEPTEAPRSPSPASSVCTFATAPIHQSEFQGPVEMHYQPGDKALKDSMTTGPSFDLQTSSDQESFVSPHSQGLHHSQPAPMPGSFPSSSDHRHDPTQATLHTSRLRKATSDGTHDLRRSTKSEFFAGDTNTTAAEQSHDTSIRENPKSRRRPKGPGRSRRL